MFMKCNRKIRILAVISIILLCMGFTSKVFQNDTFYLIKIGCDILKNGIDYRWQTSEFVKTENIVIWQ